MAFLSVASAEPEPEPASEVAAPAANSPTAGDAPKDVAAETKPKRSRKKLSAEQKKARKEARMAKYAKMTPEEKKAHKLKRAQRIAERKTRQQSSTVSA